MANSQTPLYLDGVVAKNITSRGQLGFERLDLAGLAILSDQFISKHNSFRASGHIFLLLNKRRPTKSPLYQLIMFFNASIG